jgi:hypothetical protein
MKFHVFRLQILDLHDIHLRISAWAAPGLLLS